MRFTLPGLFLAAISVWAQAPAAPQPLNLPNVPPDTLVATINGHKVTAADFKRILEGMAPQFQAGYQRDPRAFLDQYALFSHLFETAVKSGLDQKAPYKERIENAKMQILVSGSIEEYSNTIKIDPAEEQKFYETNKDRFTQAEIKAIYLPFTSTPPSLKSPDGSTPAKKESTSMTEAQARAKAEDLVKQARAGGDFVKLVKENSKDSASVAKNGDFGTISRGDALPEPVKTAIFSQKAGQVTDPVRLSNGFYIFRVEKIGTQPYEKVRSDIYQELREKLVRTWFESQKKLATAKVENEAYFGPAKAPAAPAPAK